MSDTVQNIKDKLSIVDVVSQYVKLERSGSTLRARCPFHAERTPSFFVSPERGTYHCFGCSVGGDIFSFVQTIEGLDFKGALKVLAEKAGVEIVYSRGKKEDDYGRDRLFTLMETTTIFYTSRLTEEAKKYLNERGVTDATMKNFRLGWAGNEWSELSDYLKTKKFTEKEILDAGVAKKSQYGSADWRITDKFRNRILFPIADSAGRVVGFSGRIFGAHASPEAPKYLNSPETPLFHKSRILYGFDKAKLSMRKHNCAVLVEGQLDLLASYQAGWSNTVAVSGTAFTIEHAALIRRITDNLVIALDADEAGLKATGRAARAALQGGLNVKVAQLPDGLDPADLILKNGKETWSTAIREAKEIITFLLDVLESHAKSPDNFRRNVESVVLPYLNDIPSPIARESYVREIANRLGVSQHAIVESLARVPRMPEATEKKQHSEKPLVNRAAHAYAILLWQKSIKTPAIDVAVFERNLANAIGKDVLEELAALPHERQEELRFAAEQLHADGPALALQAHTLLEVLHKERLAHELSLATNALRKAEQSGREDEIAIHMKSTKLLTQKIAELHKKG